MSADDPESRTRTAADGSIAQPEEGSSRERCERLFRQHNEALLWFLNARLRSWAEAKDVAQEAYVKLLGLDEDKAVSHLRAYLYRTADNLAKDRLRKREVRERHEHLVFFDATERDNPSPEGWWIAQQERERLEQAVAELPPKCRLAFTLAELEGKPSDAVAAYMGVKPNTVRQFVHRAYGYLAEALASVADTSRRGK